MSLKASELILNTDHSVYHLGLRAEDIGDTIITVGDPQRVAMVSQHFDRLFFTNEKREFTTHTGELNGQLISVISTGIGTDNIDIVFNELNAIAQYDLNTKTKRKDARKFKFIRIGTTGSIQKDIPINSTLINTAALSLDGLLWHYTQENRSDLLQVINKEISWPQQLAKPYLSFADDALLVQFNGLAQHQGISYTANGFYGPQFRSLFKDLQYDGLLHQLQSFQNDDRRFSNIEMETAGIYGLANHFSHKAISINKVLANRVNGRFSANPEEQISQLISEVLTKL